MFTGRAKKNAKNWADWNHHARNLGPPGRYPLARPSPVTDPPPHGQLGSLTLTAQMEGMEIIFTLESLSRGVMASSQLFLETLLLHRPRSSINWIVCRECWVAASLPVIALRASKKSLSWKSTKVSAIMMNFLLFGWKWFYRNKPFALAYSYYKQ